ncbi:MAG: uracil-DNA glycosylase [Candidatus Omnitrophica bacterium]|nr:uracil-DNA glycosylase [Candidatus Omnitrophota bacterium]
MTKQTDNRSIDVIINAVRGHCAILKEEGITRLDLPFCVVAQGAAELEPVREDSETGVDPHEKRERLLALKEKVLCCGSCEELVKNRTKMVFGAGNANAELCFVGEAPGRDEDIQGVPFVGRAGQLLTRIIESIGLTREQVFITNVLKCRPPQNRNPRPEEIINCEAFLIEQLAAIKPRVICALGTFAAQTLLHTQDPISRLRGGFHDYHGIKLVATFHPAFLLRSPQFKQHVWEDMKMIRRELDKRV